MPFHAAPRPVLPCPVLPCPWQGGGAHVASAAELLPLRRRWEVWQRGEEVGDMALLATADQESRGDVATAIAVLRQRFGERLQTGAEIRRQHGNVITWIPNQPPDGVIWVENSEEVRQVVDVARTHGVPIIPFGAGTSLEG